MDIQKINNLLGNNGIIVTEYKKNNKEHYVHTQFCDNDYTFDTMVPIVYRRAALDLQTEEDVATYLCSIKEYFTKESVNKWFKNELFNIPDKKGIKYDFIRILLSSHGRMLLSSEFPQNPNAQKIIQGWRDEGYIISTVVGNKNTNKETPHWILPLPKIKETVYERMSKPFVQRVLSVLGGINVYECRKSSGDLPDHKFSEVRWDENTPAKNSIEMSPEEIRRKFQILDTQRNQQKREVCRHCYEFGERGTIYGIEFYYEGGKYWDPSIPKTGKDAEKGCIGCPWYDIQKWREELQKKINDSS